MESMNYSDDKGASLQPPFELIILDPNDNNCAVLGMDDLDSQQPVYVEFSSESGVSNYLSYCEAFPLPILNNSQEQQQQDKVQVVPNFPPISNVSTTCIESLESYNLETHHSLPIDDLVMVDVGTELFIDYEITDNSSAFSNIGNTTPDSGMSSIGSEESPRHLSNFYYDKIEFDDVHDKSFKKNSKKSIGKAGRPRINKNDLEEKLFTVKDKKMRRTLKNNIASRKYREKKMCNFLNDEDSLAQLKLERTNMKLQYEQLKREIKILQLKVQNKIMKYNMMKKCMRNSLQN